MKLALNPLGLVLQQMQLKYRCQQHLLWERGPEASQAMARLPATASQSLDPVTPNCRKASWPQLGRAAQAAPPGSRPKPCKPHRPRAPTGNKGLSLPPRPPIRAPGTARARRRRPHRRSTGTPGRRGSTGGQRSCPAPSQAGGDEPPRRRVPPPHRRARRRRGRPARQRREGPSGWRPRRCVPAPGPSPWECRRQRPEVSVGRARSNRLGCRRPRRGRRGQRRRPPEAAPSPQPGACCPSRHPKTHRCHRHRKSPS
mmetsp:Transcript_121418/g.388264  ORF Transcript_121418/g.388264 Transcript_121418/m.388264 type:complete len:256 (-) Transcript_121418:520-1287(-)